MEAVSDISKLDINKLLDESTLKPLKPSGTRAMRPDNVAPQPNTNNVTTQSNTNNVADAVFELINSSFEFNQQSVRMAGTINEPWFCARDIIKILGYKNISDALKDHVDTEERLTLRQILQRIAGCDPLEHESDAYNTNELNTNYINESGLYSLIIGSRKPEAKAFKNWVTKEVLCNLRKQYMDKYNLLQQETQQKITELQDRNQWLEKKSKANVSFKLYDKKDAYVYFGGCLLDILNYLWKIGKFIETRAGNRVKDLSTGMSPNNPFKVFKRFHTYSNISKPWETYMHALLEPIRVRAGAGTSTEFFMANPEWMIWFMERCMQQQDEQIKYINDYLHILKENEFNLQKTRDDVCKIYKLKPINLDEFKEQERLPKQEETTNEQQSDIQDVSQPTNKQQSDMQDKNQSAKQTRTPPQKPVIDFNDPNQTKICSMCKEEKPISEFNFHNKEEGKLKEQCKTCLLNQQQARREQKKLDPLYNKKVCVQCKESKPANLFFKVSTDNNTLWDTCFDCHNIGKSIIEKQCHTCYEIKPNTEFGKDLSKTHGTHTICKKCQNKSAAETRARNNVNICPTCKQNFSRPTALNSHIKRGGCLSPEQQAINLALQKTCENCKREFTTRKGLLQHLKRKSCQNNTNDNESIEENDNESIDEQSEDELEQTSNEVNKNKLAD